MRVRLTLSHIAVTGLLVRERRDDAEGLALVVRHVAPVVDHSSWKDIIDTM